MPFTPLHIGPSAWLALSLKGRIDPVVFVLSNVIIDIEPLLIGLYWPYLSAHGYLHSFLACLPIGVAMGMICYGCKGLFERLKSLLRLQHCISLKNMVFSAILGLWFHVLLDAFVEPSIHPFSPIKANPLFGLISLPVLKWLCALSFIPAALLFINNYDKYRPAQKYNRFF